MPYRLLSSRFGRRWSRCASSLLLLVFAGAPLGAQPVEILHEDVSCLVAGQYPEIDACFEPADSVARARVYFRAAETTDWYYVDMAAEGACFRGTLPQPNDSITQVDYYVAATDRGFVETRTAEFAPSVVGNESQCSGLVAPYVGSASVVVQAVSGALPPAGFAGAGVVGTGISTATIVGVGAGAAGAVGGAIVATGGGSEAPASTSPSSPPAGTSPTEPTSNTPSPTPTPTPEPTTPTEQPTPVPPSVPSGCDPEDSAAPSVVILEPAKNADVGAEVEIVAEVSDPGPHSSGLTGVRIFAEEQGGSRRVEIASLAPSGSIYRATWTLPACAGPGDRWYINVQATDRCEQTGGSRVRVKRRGDSCDAVAAASQPGQASLWTSELEVPAGQGQVIVNGAAAVFAGSGVHPLSIPTRPGTNRVEAVLVSADGEGQWRFSLASGPVKAGSLRVVAGEPVALGPATVAFGLEGQTGERIVFTFDRE